MQLPSNEWSGTLFYNTKGTIEDNDLELIATDFYLQDIGVSTFTEFQNDTSLAGYVVDHELMDDYQGLIHSHNNMSTFFSGTDMNTLREEGNDRNHFLSLIVNNAGVYTAKFTRKINISEHKSCSRNYNTYGNVFVELPNNEVDISYEEIEYFNLNIIIEQPNESQQELKQRLTTLRADAKSYVNSRGFPKVKQEYPTWIKEDYSKDKELPFAKSVNDYKENVSLKEDKKPAQLTIFEEDEVENTKYYDNSAYADIHCDADLIKNDVIQLITGNLFSIWNKNIDLDSWVANMVKLYNKRFPDFEDFEYWADMMVSFLENDFKDDSLSEIPKKYQLEIWAADLMDALMQLPINKYIKAYMEILEAYLA